MVQKSKVDQAKDRVRRRKLLARASALRLLTAIWVDPYGCWDFEPEQEVKNLKEKFTQILAPATLEVYTPASSLQLKPATDLILFDYGGMMAGSGDLIESNCRELIRWAEDHPSCLIMVVSTMTWTGYMRYVIEELHAEQLLTSNLLAHDPIAEDRGIPRWFLEWARQSPKAS